MIENIINEKGKAKLTIIAFLPLYGCLSTGIIYVGVGVIAILSFLKVRKGGADEGSLVVLLNGSLIGKIFIWVILLGTISYIIWRIYESITDPYDYGKAFKGIILRTGIALSTIADFLIAYSVILTLLGESKINRNGQPTEEHRVIGNILQEAGGISLIIGLGCIILLTAIVQLFYGVTKGYRERLDIDKCNSITKKSIGFLAWSGYLSRGIMLGIVAISFIKAGIVKNATYVVNTDKAFDLIGDNAGEIWFILAALGTICYGLFMFVLGFAYDIEKG
ncbi:MAG TPA: DUF1206 domain-containing protein [Cytophagaceae bacterium]|jgi:hypothetical protein